MPVAHAVLGVLARGPRHGYELRRALEEELGADWRVDYGQLYRVLARLERAGWVRLRPPGARRRSDAQGARDHRRRPARARALERQPPAAPTAGATRRRCSAASPRAPAPPLTVGASDDAVLDAPRRQPSRIAIPSSASAPAARQPRRPVGAPRGARAARRLHLLDVDTGASTTSRSSNTCSSRSRSSSSRSSAASRA